MVSGNVSYIPWSGSWAKLVDDIILDEIDGSLSMSYTELNVLLLGN